MPRNVYGPDHEAFRETVREFVERSLKPRAEDFLKDKAMRPRGLARGRRSRGFSVSRCPSSTAAPRAGDYRFNAVLTEELSKVTAAPSSCFGIHTDIVAPYLVDLTTEEQKQRWLPGFCSGEIVTAIAMTEPSGGSDLAALKTTAVRDGDDWVLNGSKTFITNGYSADLVVVAARTSPEKGAKGITLFGVETGMAGFERGRKLDKVGQEESDTAELFFEDVRVPDDNLHRRGRPRLHRHDGAAAAGAARRRGRPTLAHAQQILRRDHRLRQGAQGLRPADRLLPAQQVPARRAASPRSRSPRRTSTSASPRTQERRADRGRRREGQVVVRARCRTTCSTHCVQLHGGYGYMNEYRVARAWRDARVTKIWAGSNEIMKELIGRDLGL